MTRLKHANELLELLNNMLQLWLLIQDIALPLLA